MAAKLRRMLERKIDLWDPEEVFELMPTLMKVHFLMYDDVDRRRSYDMYVHMNE